MKIRFLALAQKEFDNAVDWYNGQATELGAGISRCSGPGSSSDRIFPHVLS